MGLETMLRFLRAVPAFLLFIVVLIFTPRAVFSNSILINEILTSTSNVDEFGTPLEWIEIYNPGPEILNLEGYSLTDDPLSPRKWLFPSDGSPCGWLFSCLGDRIRLLQSRRNITPISV